MTVSREEFDKLVTRVDRIERTLGIDARLDSYTAQVQQAIKVGSDAAARNERFARAIADHFGIQLPDDPE